MLFGSKKSLSKVNKPDVYLGNTKLEYDGRYDYLGFVFDVNLDFEDHLTRMLQRVNAKAVILYKIRTFINPGTMLQLYKALLLPVLEYGDQLLTSCTTKSLEKLQKFQNRIL